MAQSDNKALIEAAEMLDDLRAYDEAKAGIVAGEELIPSEVTFALLDGENPITVWRRHRGLTQQQLAEEAKISKVYLSQLEASKRTGTMEVLGRIASVLRVDLDDLVASERQD